MRAPASSATRHYLRAGRAAARRDRNRATAALYGAASVWSNKIVTTTWLDQYKTKGGTTNGERQEQTVADFVEERKALGDMVFAKGEGPVATLATTDAGSLDAECTSRTGLYLDADFSGDWSRIIEMLDGAKLTYFGQRRLGRKFHLLIPYAKSIVPTKDTRRWKDEYVRKLGWILGLMSEIAWPGDDGVYFDPATSRLCTLEYLYTRRTEEEAPPEIASLGALALNWDSVLRVSGFQAARDAEAKAARAPIRSAWQVTAEAPSPTSEMWQREPVRARLMELLQWKARRRHRDPEAEAQFTLLDQALRGKAFASPHGGVIDGVELPPRHDAIVRLAGTLAIAIPRTVPTRIITEILLPSFQAIDWSDERTGRARDDAAHGLALFETKLGEFRSRIEADHVPRNYAVDNAFERAFDALTQKDREPCPTSA